jgi:hypothetical protein
MQLLHGFIRGPFAFMRSDMGRGGWRYHFKWAAKLRPGLSVPVVVPPLLEKWYL